MRAMMRLFAIGLIASLGKVVLSSPVVLVACMAPILSWPEAAMLPVPRAPSGFLQDRKCDADAPTSMTA